MIEFSESDFRDAFPEFRPLSADKIQLRVTEARLEMDETRFGDLGQAALMFLVAHKLASTPFGMNARLVDSENKTTYWKDYQRLARIAGTPSAMVS